MPRSFSVIVSITHRPTPRTRILLYCSGSCHCRGQKSSAHPPTPLPSNSYRVFWTSLLLSAIVRQQLIVDTQGSPPGDCDMWKAHQHPRLCTHHYIDPLVDNSFVSPSTCIVSTQCGMEISLIGDTLVSMQALLQNALFDGTILFQREHYGKVD